MLNAHTGDSSQFSGAPAGNGTQPPPPPSRSGPNWLLIGAIFVLLMVLMGGMILLIVAVGAMSTDGDTPFPALGERVGVITISGIITSAGAETLIGGTVGGSRATMRQLRQAATDDSIKAVVLRIDSPGGSPAASQEIYHEVARLADKKPVVVSMGDVAASGGYYVAAPADRIVASGSTVTGSIGVRMQFLQYYELLERYGIEGGSLTTGPYKDTGSPFRDMREDEERLLQGILDDMYEQFVRDIAAGREMEDQDIRGLADGRIFTGEQALEVGLIDELGNFYRAVEIAGELGGIVGEPRLKEIERRGGFFDMFGVLSRPGPREALERLLYDERLERIDRFLQPGG